MEETVEPELADAVSFEFDFATLPDNASEGANARFFDLIWLFASSTPSEAIFILG